MSIFNFKLGIQCTRPNWAIVNPDPKYTDVRYRLYVNDDLITERTWIWPNGYWLNENIWVSGNERFYTIRLEPVLNVHNQADFQFKEFKLLNRVAKSKQVNRTDILLELA